MRQDTLVFLVNDDTQELLLAMKKRGLGIGKRNGVGGKVQAGETIEAAAVREAQEEVLVLIQEKDLVKVAELTFHFKDKPEWSINCHVFFACGWTTSTGSPWSCGATMCRQNLTSTTTARSSCCTKSMEVKIEPIWKAVLTDEFGKEYFAALTSFVKDEYKKGAVYPAPKNI